ncbi:MAG: ATP-binding protein [Kiritimatiellae bacterium]|nr:ATP-binding protein [Kiritimatiellia bacterium]
MYIKRRLEESIRRALGRNPVAAVLGPRQCGKSTLVKHLREEMGPSVYLDLERPSDLAKLSDPELFFSRHKEELICIDEIQRKSDLFPVIRSLCDDWGGNGHFLVLGSASRDLIRQSSESLAGRIRYERLTPFLFSELDGADWTKCLSRGGFPRAYLASSNNASNEWHESFIQTFLERDLLFWRDFVPETMRRLWRMLAHENAHMINYSRLAASLGVSDMTIKRYIDLLKETFMVDVVPPYISNLGKRLVKTPKVYLCDTGLTCALLGLGAFDEIYAHPAFGGCWEQMVLANVRGLYPDADVSFYRTSAGAEMDFVVKKGRRTVALACKASTAPSVGKGTYFALDAIRPDAAYVVAPVDETYALNDRMTAMPLSALGDIFV